MTRQDIGVDEDQWYDEAVTSTVDWRTLYRRIADGTSSGQAAELPQTEICKHMIFLRPKTSILASNKKCTLIYNSI